MGVVGFAALHPPYPRDNWLVADRYGAPAGNGVAWYLTLRKAVPMTESDRKYEVVPFPKVRLRITDFLGLMHRKHIIHALIEVDVTAPRQHIRRHRSETGEGLSFTAFMTACLAKAVDEDRYMHAYRKGRKQLVVFEEVDVATVVEHEMDGARVATPHVFRAANKKTFAELHGEMRAARQRKAREFRKMPLREKLFFALPAFVRVPVLDATTWSPRLRKKVQGTVAITAVGMFGGGVGWGIPMTSYTLCITVGGIAEKPGVVGGQIEVREFLNMTVSVDHEIVDGAPLAKFTTRLKELIESGYGLDPQGGGS
jgi:pyruvate/2-oxoglutarate dehydrogenase complex dihydrolipoamide acyltransferase (E2) component